MLEVKNLSKTIDDNKILENINITINEGEIVGLVGSNGCGKSTLLNCITTVYNGEKGKVILNKEIIKDNIKLLEDIYYIQDDLYFRGRSSLIDVFNFEKELYPNASKEVLRKYAGVFDIDVHKSLNSMSKGQKKKAAFILAIASNTKILLFDELIDGVDAVVKRKIWNVILDEIYNTNRILFMTSHDLREIERFCGRVYLMDDGQIVSEISMSNIEDEYKIIQFAVDGVFDEGVIESVTIIKTEVVGSITKVVIKGNDDEFYQELTRKYEVKLFDKLDITLEEVFVSELGGE